jgi:hypothetical protein
MDAGGIADDGRLGVLGRDRKARVVLSQIDLAKEPIGGLEGGDADELELLGQPVLEGAEGPFGTAASLGRGASRAR